MLVFGRIGDLFGHDRVFGWGLVVCIAGFSVCSLASSYNWLLMARMAQGVGTAMVLSCGPALATNLFDEKLRPRVLGAYAMMFGLGGAIGPSLGGWLVELWGWPAVFWFRLPLAVTALVMMFVVGMPQPPRDQSSFDYRSSILLAVTTALLLATTTQLDQFQEHPLRVAVLGMAALASIVAYIAVSKRSASPVLNLSAFSDFTFTWINVATVVVNLAGFATMLFVPYFLVRASDLPLWQSGIIMAVGPLGMMFAANLGGRIINVIGARRLALISIAFVAAGLELISHWNGMTGRLLLCSALLIHGVGLGFFQVTCLEIVAAALPKANRGVAGSLVLVMRTIGVVLAASLLTLGFAHFETQSNAADATERFITAFRMIFQVAALGLAVFVGCSLVRTSLWLRQPP
jgi:MFS family permease